MEDVQMGQWWMAGRGDADLKDRARRREEARVRLREIARIEGIQWLLREAQVIALWANDTAH